jgi:hypothetical protein
VRDPAVVGQTTEKRSEQSSRAPGGRPMQNRRELVAELWVHALRPFLVTRIGLTLAGLLATFYVILLMRPTTALLAVPGYARFPDALWLMWQRFDSGFYLGIASGGYWSVASLQHPSNWVFWPLFPVLVHPWGALSTLLAASIACMYYARRRQWWVAGFCGDLAALSRGQGVFLVIPLAWELWQVLSDQYAPLPQGRPASLQALVVSRVRGPLLAARHLDAW